MLPRFFPKLLEEHRELDLRVAEMKTDEIKRALTRGELDAAVLVNLDNMDSYEKHPLYYEQFLAYVAETDTLASAKSVRIADLTDEFLWLLGEGHCFRNQLVKFCSLKAARRSQDTYSLGSIETFMRMVEGGMGVTFIPELALPQLSERQCRLVRPFAVPIPTREVVLMTARSFVRNSILELIQNSIRSCVPEEMLRLNNTEQRV